MIDADKLIDDLVEIACAGYPMVTISGVIAMIEAAANTDSKEDNKTE